MSESFLALKVSIPNLLLFFPCFAKPGAVLRPVKLSNEGLGHETRAPCPHSELGSWDKS